MAKSYTIVITDETEQSKSPVAKSSSGESLSSKKTKIDKKMLASYHYAKRALQVATSYTVDTIQLRTGSVTAQQDADFAYQIINDVYNIGESIVVGAATGGAVGAIVGAVVGTVFKVANVSIAGMKINTSRSLETITIGQNAIRIGAGGGRMGDVK